METKKLLIPNITCKHCVMAIQNELCELKGISDVQGDPNSKTITVKWEEPANIEKIKEKLKEIDYPAE